MISSNSFKDISFSQRFLLFILIQGIKGCILLKNRSLECGLNDDEYHFWYKSETNLEILFSSVITFASMYREEIFLELLRFFSKLKKYAEFFPHLLAIWL